MAELSPADWSTAQDQAASRHFDLMDRQCHRKLGEGTQDIFKDNIGFNGIARHHRLLKFELHDLRQSKMGRSILRPKRSPQGARGLRATFDQENARHERLAGKMIRKKRKAWIEPLPTATLLARHRDGK